MKKFKYKFSDFNALHSSRLLVLEESSSKRREWQYLLSVEWIGDKIKSVYFWNFFVTIISKMSGVSEKVYNMYERRQAIPILYVRGTHYDVGYDVVIFSICNLISCVYMVT